MAARMFRITIANDAFEVGLDLGPERGPRAAASPDVDARSLRAFPGKGHFGLRLLREAGPDMWLGQWATRNLEVKIGRIGTDSPDQPLTAAVNDRTGKTPISFVDSFVPGPERIVSIAHSPLSAVIASQTADPTHCRRLGAAARGVLSQIKGVPPGKLATVRRFRSAMAHSHVPPAISHIVGRTLATLVQGGAGSGFLDAYVVLHLYEALQDGELLGLRLGYQRYASTGERVCNALLSLAVNIR